MRYVQLTYTSSFFLLYDIEHERSGEGFREDSEALGVRINKLQLPFNLDNARFAISESRSNVPDLPIMLRLEGGVIGLKWLVSFIYHTMQDIFCKRSRILVTQR